MTFGASAILIVFGAALATRLWLRRSPSVEKWAVSREKIAEILASTLGGAPSFPTEVQIASGQTAHLAYTIDARLQERMERAFQDYEPDYGAFVALDAPSGRVLALVGYAGKGARGDRIPGGLGLPLRASYPSASVFKVVTAAAALSSGKFRASTVIPFNGANHTLYRGNVLKPRVTRWTRHVTLGDAFARSINTVFGRIGVFDLGAGPIADFASRFGFNRRLSSDLPLEDSKLVPPEDDWDLAEVASGFTRETRMSPLHGALMAAAIANGGDLPEPYVVESAVDPRGEVLYRGEPRSEGMAVSREVAAELREMMRETIARGTSRRAFRGFSRGVNADVEVGGKTGSLNGDDPPGRYDWFVGYASGRGRTIALAALAIHGKYWKVKSSALARLAIETYFGQELAAR